MIKKMSKLSLFFITIFTLLLLVSCGTKKYTVSFDSNGGTAVVSQVVTKNKKATKPANPTRANYDFVEWRFNLFKNFR